MSSVFQIVDLTVDLDLRYAEAANARATHRERIALLAELQRPAAEVAAADKRDLHLLDLNCPGLRHPLIRPRRTQEQPRYYAPAVVDSGRGSIWALMSGDFGAPTHAGMA